MSKPLNPADLGAAISAPFNLWGPTRVGTPASFVGGSSAPEAQGSGPVSSAFSSAVAASKKAASAVFSTLLTPPGSALEAASARVADASAEAIDAGAQSVKAAGSGIYAGFKWAVLIGLGLVILYVMSLLVAITPRRS